MTDTIDETGGAEAHDGYFGEHESGGDTYVSLSAENPAARLMEAEAMRMAEALVFASREPVSERALAERLPDGVDVLSRPATGDGDVLLVAVGAFAQLGIDVAAGLAERGIGALVVDPRWVLPVPGSIVEQAREVGFTIEPAP